MVGKDLPTLLLRIPLQHLPCFVLEVGNQPKDNLCFSPTQPLIFSKQLSLTDCRHLHEGGGVTACCSPPTAMAATRGEGWEEFGGWNAPSLHEDSEGPTFPTRLSSLCAMWGFPFLSLLPRGPTRHLRKSNFAPATAPAVAKLVRCQASLQPVWEETGKTASWWILPWCQAPEAISAGVPSYLTGTEILYAVTCKYYRPDGSSQMPAWNPFPLHWRQGSCTEWGLQLLDQQSVGAFTIAAVKYMSEQMNLKTFGGRPQHI